MKIPVLVCLLATIVAVAPVSSQSGFDFNVQAASGVQLGSAAYDLKADAGSYDVKSRLEFPLGSIFAGTRFDGAMVRSERKVWLLEAAFSVNLTSPFGLMKDYDWDEYSGYPQIPWSYTESDATLLALEGSAAFANLIRRWGIVSLYFQAEYTFCYIYQEVLGYDGWFYEWISDNHYDGWLVSSDEKAMKYTLVTHAPGFGVRLKVEPSPDLSVDLSAAGLLVFAYDEDDHLLRNKLSTASCVGIGFHGNLRATYTGGSQGSKVRPVFGLAADFFTMHTGGDQRQEWYGDDPASSGYDDTGDVEKGIDHVITDLRFRIGITGGLHFLPQPKPKPSS